MEYFKDSPYRCHFHSSSCSFSGKYKMDNDWFCQKHLVITYNVLNDKKKMFSEIWNYKPLKRKIPKTLIIKLRTFSFSFNRKDGFVVYLTPKLFKQIYLYKQKFYEANEEIEIMINKQIKEGPLRKIELDYILSDILQTEFHFSKPILKLNLNGDNCTICLETLEFSNKLKTDCSHYFHEKCLLEWLNNQNKSCPCCRKQIISN